MVKGSLSCFNLGMRFWLFNPNKWEVCTQMSIPDNKFNRMKYFNNFVKKTIKGSN